MALSIGIGCALIMMTTVIHAAFMMLALGAFRRPRVQRWAHGANMARASVIATIVLVMFVAAVIEAVLWAATYRLVGAITNFEESAYFSMVTYTTLGFGDVVLETPWRMLSTFQAANGIMMFGWTTALIAAAVTRLYLHPLRHADGR